MIPRGAARPAWIERVKQGPEWKPLAVVDVFTGLPRCEFVRCRKPFVPRTKGRRGGDRQRFCSPACCRKARWLAKHQANGRAW